MGRANMMILIFGIGAFVLMALMMRRAAKIQGAKTTHPVVAEVVEAFGSSLAARPKFEKKGIADQVLGILSVRFNDAERERSRAQIIGRRVWRMARKDLDFDRLQIIVLGEQGEPKITVEIANRSHWSVRPRNRKNSTRAKPAAKFTLRKTDERAKVQAVSPTKKQP